MSANQRRVQRSAGNRSTSNTRRTTQSNVQQRRTAAQRRTSTRTSAAQGTRTREQQTAAQGTRTRGQQTGSVRASGQNRTVVHNNGTGEYDEDDDEDEDTDSWEDDDVDEEEEDYDESDDEDDDDEEETDSSSLASDSEGEPGQLGLKFADIDRVSTTFNYVEPPESSSKGEDTCTICLEHFKATQCIRKLRCGHEFHSRCLVPWLLRQTTCPNCRRKMPLKR